MPVYIYKCNTCEKRVEINHSMNEIDNPSQEVIDKTSCGCSENTGERFNRIPGNVLLGNMQGGSSVAAKSEFEVNPDLKAKAEKQTRQHFKEEVYPSLDKEDQQMFDNRKKNED